MKPFKKFVALLASILFISALAACGSATHSTTAQAQPVALVQNKSTSLVGKWHQTNEGVPGATMTAVITSDKIDITLKLGDSSGVFWTGTFDPNAPSTDPYSVVSNGDLPVLSESLFGSDETTKTFSYQNGVLSYEFSMMGVSSTIQLSK